VLFRSVLAGATPHPFEERGALEVIFNTIKSSPDADDVTVRLLSGSLSRERIANARYVYEAIQRAKGATVSGNTVTPNKEILTATVPSVGQTRTEAKQEARTATETQAAPGEYQFYLDENAEHEPIMKTLKNLWGRVAGGAEGRQVGGSHYTNKKVQPWSAMEAWMTAEQFEGFLRGSAIAYLARYPEKGGRQDVEKAQHYIQRLLEHLEEK